MDSKCRINTLCHKALEGDTCFVRGRTGYVDGLSDFPASVAVMNQSQLAVIKKGEREPAKHSVRLPSAGHLQDLL